MTGTTGAEGMQDDTAVARTPPVALQRALLVESGHRCAIPTCRSTSVLEFAHIVPWFQVKEHTFENMIVLCAMCHGLYDREKKIDRKAMRAYKANLGLLNSRYNDFETRMLELFRERGEGAVITLDYGAQTDINVRNLVRDGIVARSPAPGGTQRLADGSVAFTLPASAFIANDRLPRVNDSVAERLDGKDDYTLTAAGVDLIKRWFDAVPIDDSTI